MCSCQSSSSKSRSLPCPIYLSLTRVPWTFAVLSDAGGKGSAKAREEPPAARTFHTAPGHNEREPAASIAWFCFRVYIIPDVLMSRKAVQDPRVSGGKTPVKDSNTGC